MSEDQENSIVAYSQNEQELLPHDAVFVRMMEKDDRGFLISAFLNSLYYGCSFFNMSKKDSFHKNYHKITEAILDNPAYIKQVLVLKETPDVVLGFSIYKPSNKSLIFVYVKASFRGFGFMKMLTDFKIETVAHLTTTGIRLLKKYPEIVFDPFSI